MAGDIGEVFEIGRGRDLSPACRVPRANNRSNSQRGPLDASHVFHSSTFDCCRPSIVSGILGMKRMPHGFR